MKEKFIKNAHGVIWSNHFMTNSARICIDFMIIAARLALVPEEMNLFEFFFNVLKTKTLVPSLRENIKRYLATNRES